MPVELSVRFTSDETQPDSPIHVSLFRPDTGASTNPAPFTPPLTDNDLDEIRWYLEDYSTWPTEVDRLRAERIEEKLTTWGTALTESVIQHTGNEGLLAEFLKDASDDKKITIDASDSRVLRLPWELMTDGTRHLFARDVSIRRRLQDSQPMPTRQFELPLRILVVVARPDDSSFISPRAFSKPMLDALDSLGAQVETEFLYPPTLTALTNRLHDRTKPRVHVVQFDGHGVYDETTGLGYLAFERDDHSVDLIGSDQIGTLLVGTGIPLAVLNACQSAAQEKTNPYASVAASLVQAGVGSVLAMNYSVLVTAAEIFVQAFYKSLAAGLSVGVAIDQARRALLANTLRHTFYRRDEDGNEVAWRFELRDWFLPALYQQAADPVIFAQSDGAVVPRREPATFTNAGLPWALPPEPLHGFTGRARELLKLERELAARAVVIVHGGGGMGKTTLAAEAARWFWRTGRFPGGAAFVSFEHGGSLSQLCSWVGQAISGDPNWQIGDGDPVTRVADLLAANPALVILDNFESVIGSDPVMPADELAEVLDAVWTWANAVLKAGGKGSRVLITTRDTHLNDPRYTPGKNCAHLELGGLAASDALELAGNILDSYNIERERVSRVDLRSLIAHLGGHTLSLYLVLPQLGKYTARQIIDDFETLLPGFVAGKAAERNESLKVSLEFSLRRLGAATRAALPALAVFQGGALELNILEIAEIDPDLWKNARAELEAAALVTSEPIPGMNNMEFLQFHPTLLPALGETLPAERRAALEARYWQGYYEFSGILYRDDTQHPHQVRAMALLEMPNLRRAFDLALAAALRGEADAHTPITLAGQLARFLGLFGRRRELEALRRDLERLPLTDGALTKADYLRLSGQGEALWQGGQLTEAARIFQDLLERLERLDAWGQLRPDEAGRVSTNPSPLVGTTQGSSVPAPAPPNQAELDDIAYSRGLTLWWLGRCLKGQNRRGEALGCFRQAESIFRDLGERNADAKQMQAGCLTEIGDVLRDSGRFDEAQEAYEADLAISRELKDDRGAGVTLGQLGTLAYRRGDLKTARERYQEAIDAFRALSEPAMEAVAWHQLGRVAEEEEDWDEAERCYREAVRIREAIRELHELAKSYNQLGLVARSAGRPTDAERWYLQAQKLKDTVAQQDDSTLHNLASLYESMGRLAEARTYAERAAKIVEGQDLSVEPWTTYNILADISTREGKTDEAREWRRKRNTAHDAFAGTRYELAPILAGFAGVIEASAAACAGNADARTQVEGLFETFENGGYKIAEPIRRIWAGERDAQALTENLDYQDRAIVLAILHRLGVAVPEVIPESLAMAQTSVSPQQRETLAQVLAQFRPVIDGVAAATNGNEAIKLQIEGLFEQFTKDGWQIAEPIRRIWTGERDPQALSVGLDDQDRAIVLAILHRLGVDVPAFIRELLDGSEDEEKSGDGQGQSITVEQLIEMVGQVAQGTAPQGLGAQLFDLTQKTTVDPQAPPELRALANVLHKVLAGSRTPDLAGLSDDHALLVQAMLDTLKGA
ncbi:MAG: tetratricopeptide repeat protein [Anaerolineae bacterium]|nr:tetratricopeptide repeat protein [Anaerolineae bacterium]